MSKDPYRYFRIEAREILDALGQGALALETGADGREIVVRLLRTAHTLKGAARVVKLPAVAETAHAIEDLLSPFRDAAGAVPKETAGALLRLVDQIGTALSVLG